MSRFKYIEHEKYSAPTVARRKIDGRWTYARLAKRLRDFRQRVLNRIGSMSIASRYVPHATELHKTYVDHDQLVTQLIFEGEKNPSAMAKRKYFPHRPKPQNNTAKNRARRAARARMLVAESGRGKGNKPAPALIMNAAQARVAAGYHNIKEHRRITRDQSTGHRNFNRGWLHREGGGDRECARRRRQMAAAQAAA